MSNTTHRWGGFKNIVPNGKSVAVVSGLLATKLEAITTKSTNTKSTTDNIQPRITATQCCARCL